MPEPSTARPGVALRGRVHQNLWLPRGARTVEAVVTVDAAGVGVAGAAEAAEVLVLDCSGSMGSPPSKAAAASEAAAAAIEEMRDGVWFAVLAGTERTGRIWPRHGGLQRADAATRAAAAAALRETTAAGGTRIGAWLREAARLLDAHEDAIRHAILLTDGKDEHESRAELDAAILAARGRLACDCRGVGTSWRVNELTAVASALHGTVGRVAEPSGLAADFRAMTAASMRKEVARVALRLWTPAGATVLGLAQSAPTPVDLVERRTAVDEQLGDYPTGAWGGEARDFRVVLDVPPADVGRTRLAARLSFVRHDPGGGVTPLTQSFVRTRPDGRDEPGPEALVSATWTDDPALAAGRAAAVHRAQTEDLVAARVRSALTAAEHGELDRADGLLREARTRAVEIDDDAMVGRIDALYEPGTDTLRAEQVGRAPGMDLEIETTRRTPQRDRDPT